MKYAPRILAVLFVLACALSFVPAKAWSQLGQACSGGLLAPGGAGATCAPTATPAPTPSPTPTPEFIIGVQSHTTGSLVYTGIQTGDCLVAVAYGSPSTPLNGWGAIAFGTNSLSVYLKIVTPQDTAAGNVTILTPWGSSSGTCAAAFRYLTCSTDGLATEATGTSGAPKSNTFTTTVGNDFAILASYLNSSATGAYSEPAGYTQAAFVAPVSGTNYGCDLGYAVLSTAGANSPGAGALTNPSAWTVLGFGLNGTGFVY